MGRPKVVLTDVHPYHVVARTNNKEWFDIPMAYCFGVYANVLETCVERYQIQLHAFVLMSNHFHMLVTTPNKNISQFLHTLMTQTAKGIGKKSNRINHLYGARNHKSVISTPEYYALCLKYIYRNPVNAGIARTVEEFRWSTVANARNKIMPLIERPKNGHDALLPEARKDCLDWYNTTSDFDVEKNLKVGLRKSVCKIKRYTDNKKPLNIEDALPTRRVPGTCLAPFGDAGFT